MGRWFDELFGGLTSVSPELVRKSCETQTRTTSGFSENLTEKQISQLKKYKQAKNEERQKQGQNVSQSLARETIEDAENVSQKKTVKQWRA